ncbi:hypothetical protein [Desulfosudis oleivorans]|uniref:DUF3102 domain-containing protein n=1 Tax=Desulfosudis oleivorans (strain DSM 6200 / JCM 39069 / Hxd3) TaxID=96561 RepID=A8ZXF7_DESOH|nr:hypothetical protein [Desulfosudis oleivorans]ABW68536.1 hypothetical protein Dole_2733 [Desulfosudis oleivorans Hxd3]
MTHRTEENHINQILEIEKVIISLEGDLVEQRFNQGLHLLRLKEGHKNFKAYAEEHLPGIHPRTLQRAEQIARYANIEDYPAFRHLGFSILLELMCNEKNKHVAIILDREDIDIPEDEEDMAELNQFRFEVNKYLDAKKEKLTKKAKKSPPKKPSAEKTSKKKKAPGKPPHKKTSAKKPSPGKKPSGRTSIKEKAEAMDKDELVKTYSVKVNALAKWSKAIKDREFFDGVNPNALEKLIKRLKFIRKKIDE